MNKHLVASLLGFGSLVSLGFALFVPTTPAPVQFTVFDPSNYSQNLLTAARSLQQINNQVRSLQHQAESLINQALTNDQHVVDARARRDTSMAAFHRTMTVQAQVAENVSADAQTLNGIVARSQVAEGSLQAQQATNQLLVLAAKQQFQIQNLMAAQYRADAIEQARRVQAESDARAATTKFLGSGSAYTPR